MEFFDRIKLAVTPKSKQIKGLKETVSLKIKEYNDLVEGDQLITAADYRTILDGIEKKQEDGPDATISYLKGLISSYDVAIKQKKEKFGASSQVPPVTPSSTPEHIIQSAPSAEDEKNGARRDFWDTLNRVNKVIDRENPRRQKVDAICRTLSANLTAWDAKDIRQATTELRDLLDSETEENELKKGISDNVASLKDKIRNDPDGTIKPRKTRSEEMSNFMSSFEKVKAQPGLRDSVRQKMIPLASEARAGVDSWSNYDYTQAKKKMENIQIDDKKIELSENEKKGRLGGYPTKAWSSSSLWKDRKIWEGEKGEVNKKLKEHDEEHEKSWNKEKKKQMATVNGLLNNWRIIRDAIDSEKLTPNQELQQKQKLAEIERQLAEYGIFKDVQGDWFSAGGAEIDELEQHLDSTTKEAHESEGLKKRRELEKKYGIRKGGEYGGSSGGKLTSVASWLGLADESGLGVVVNFLAWPITWYITVYGVIGPIIDTFSFFIPFLNILQYPIYIIGMIILHPFIKAILHPFKEDFYSLFEHEEGYYSSKKRMKRQEEGREEKAREELDIPKEKKDEE